MVQERNLGLDGLRGMAILLVLLHHFFRLPGGWVGVDGFFVLSGFLITTILRNDRQERHFWPIYFARRATRILPPFLILMFVAAVTVSMNWRQLWPYYAFFGANLASYRFGEAVGSLGALWSLAIEEHFYFVWPTVVRKTSDRTLAMIALGVLVCEPLLRVSAWSLGLHNILAFYILTPFRLDGLALGALLSVALSLDRTKVWLGRWMYAISTILVLACVVCFGWLKMDRIDHALFFVAAGYSLIALTCGVLVCVVVLEPRGWLSRILSLQPLRFLGKISYGFYIYHALVIYLCTSLLARLNIQHFRSMASLPISLVLAWASFRFVETPILSYGRRLVAERKRDVAAVTELP